MTTPATQSDDKTDDAPTPDRDALTATERAAARTLTEQPDGAAGIKDLRGAKIAVGIAVAAALLMAFYFMAHYLGAKSIEPQVVTKIVPAVVPTNLVSKDLDDNACAFAIVPQGEAFKDGWCEGRTAGAYLFDDGTAAYCSCGKPRK